MQRFGYSQYCGIEHGDPALGSAGGQGWMQELVLNSRQSPADAPKELSAPGSPRALVVVAHSSDGGTWCAIAGRRCRARLSRWRARGAAEAGANQSTDAAKMLPPKPGGLAPEPPKPGFAAEPPKPVGFAPAPPVPTDPAEPPVSSSPPLTVPPQPGAAIPVANEATVTKKGSRKRRRRLAMLE